MRYVALLILFAAGLRADEASKAAKVEELLRVMKTENTLEQVYGQMTKQVDLMTRAMAQQHHVADAQQPQLAELSKRLMAIVSEQLSWDKMEPLYVKIYSDVFDESEIDALLTFYRSPAGQTYVEKTPLVMQKTDDAMQSRLPEVMAAIQKAALEFAQQQHAQKP